MKIAIIGGTGAEGLGLAMRVAKAGQEVLIGSPTAGAVAPAEVVFLTVPWDAHQSTLQNLAEAIGEKVLVDVVVPMLFDRGQAKAILVDEGSAAQQVRALDAGGLANSRYLEEFTVLLLHINHMYKARSGVRIVGV